MKIEIGSEEYKEILRNSPEVKALVEALERALLDHSEIGYIQKQAIAQWKEALK